MHTRDPKLIGSFCDIINMKRSLGSPRFRLDQFRLKRLRAQLRYCYLNVPHYQRSFSQNNLNPDDFKQVSDLLHYPTITKEDIISDYAGFTSQKYRGKKYFKSHTSGSTGQPSWTFFDTRSWIRKKYLSKFRSRIACGLSFGDKIAVLECASNQAIKKYNQRIRVLKPMFRIQAFSIFDSLEKSVSDLAAFNPQNIYGTPGYLLQLARLMEKKCVHLRGLKRLFTSSEYLESNVRHFVERVFGVDIFDIYGSTEFKEIAWECKRHKGYHINEDEIICEILIDGRPAQIGEVGDIVITDLHNKAMPLIRYQLKDKGYYLDDKCGCGLNYLQMRPTGGRDSDYITLPDGEQVSPYLFTTSIEHVDGLLKYQIVQTDKHSLVVNLVLDDRHGGRDSQDEHVLSQIIDILVNVTSGTMKIEAKRCQEIKIEENGKCKVVKNLLSINI